MSLPRPAAGGESCKQGFFINVWKETIFKKQRCDLMGKGEDGKAIEQLWNSYGIDIRLTIFANNRC
jgi:hypothetical protein